MFRRALILSVLMTLASLAFAVFHYTAMTASDLAEYYRLKTERSPRALQREPAIQKRRGVRKDVWIPKEKERSRLSIGSETSDLVLIDRNGKLEATEILQNLEGEIREAGELRHFKAEEGTYFYPSHRFLAKNAHVSFHRDGAPALEGSAEKTNVSLLAQNPQLLADGVALHSGDSLCLFADHAEYRADTLKLSPSCRLEFPDAFLQCEGPLVLHTQEQMAETAFPFHYEDAEFQIDAHSGKILYAQENAPTPKTIQCEGAVRLASAENYALADELVYFPETKTLHLFAGKTSRVLFWKSDGSVQISAPEVAARFGKTEEIKGIGDVHFTFDLEEEHRIETLFGKYLQ